MTATVHPLETLPSDVERALERLLGLVDAAAAMLAHGEEQDAVRADVARDAGTASGDDASARLERWLYGAWYCADPEPSVADGVARRGELVPLLRAALPAAERWQPGWVVLRCGPDGVCVAAGRGEQRALLPGDYANLGRPGLPPEPGDGLVVTQRVDWFDEATGFWCARSPAGEATGPLVRLYLSVRPDDAGHVLREACTLLDARHLRYALKCPARAAGFVRVDSLVYYLERDAWPAIEADVRRAALALSPVLRTCRPPLTQEIAPGVGFAEDPGDGESFGSRVCRVLAPGVLALTRRRTTRRRDLDVLCGALRAGGIDPARPWRCDPVAR